MKRTPVTMPVLSDTMETGHLVRWLKKPGDPVKKGDVLAEVESDKAIMDVEAFQDGYLSGPLAPEDSDVPVREVIAYISDEKPGPDSQSADETPAMEKTPAQDSDSQADDQSVDKSRDQSTNKTNVDAPQRTQESESESESGSEPESDSEQESEKVSVSANADAQAQTQKQTQSTDSISQAKASPYARGLAMELGVPLNQVAPSADGVIHANNVLSAALQGPAPNLDAGPAWKLHAFTPMRRSVAEHMQQAGKTPTFHVSARLSLELLAKQSKQQKHSFTLLLAQAAAQTIKEMPLFNAAYTPLGLAYRNQIDIGIAMDIPGGLVTPVLRDVAGRSLDELEQSWRALKQKAKQQRLLKEDYQGGTFYISNLGMFPLVDNFDAIVPLGSAAILAIAALQDGKASVTLSADHRVVYGADCARFLEKLNDKILGFN